MPVLLGCGLAAAVLAPVIPPAAVALSWLAGAAAAWIAFTARLISGLPYAQTSSRAFALVVMGAALAAAALRALPGYRRRAAFVTALALVPVAALGWWALHPPPRWSPPTGLRVSFLDVGQGDGILLETPQGAMLVDTGPPEARVDRQLRHLGLRTLAAIVITHQHRDHVGGAPAVLRTWPWARCIDPMQHGRRLRRAGDAPNRPRAQRPTRARPPRAHLHARTTPPSGAMARSRRRTRRGSAPPRHRHARELRVDRHPADRRLRVARPAVAAAAAGRGAQGRPSRLLRSGSRRTSSRFCVLESP